MFVISMVCNRVAIISMLLVVALQSTSTRESGTLLRIAPPAGAKLGFTNTTEIKMTTTLPTGSTIDMTTHTETQFDVMLEKKNDDGSVLVSITNGRAHGFVSGPLGTEVFDSDKPGAKYSVASLAVVLPPLIYAGKTYRARISPLGEVLGVEGYATILQDAKILDRLGDQYGTYGDQVRALLKKTCTDEEAVQEVQGYFQLLPEAQIANKSTWETSLKYHTGNSKITFKTQNVATRINSLETEIVYASSTQPIKDILDRGTSIGAGVVILDMADGTKIKSATRQGSSVVSCADGLPSNWTSELTCILESPSPVGGGLMSVAATTKQTLKRRAVENNSKQGEK